MKKARKFYKTKSWLRKREVILKRDNYECRECRRYGRKTTADTVHHVTPLNVDDSLRLTSGNLLSLCSKCHNQMHDRYTDELTPIGEQWLHRKVE